MQYLVLVVVVVVMCCHSAALLVLYKKKYLIILNFANLNFLHPQQILNIRFLPITELRTSRILIKDRASLVENFILFLKDVWFWVWTCSKFVWGVENMDLEVRNLFSRIMFFFQIRLLLPLELQKTQRPESALHQKKSLCCTHRLPHPFICGPFQVSF